MQTVNFYLLPIKSYQTLSSLAVRDLVELCNQIMNNADIIKIPFSFFDSDSDGTNLYSDEYYEKSNSDIKQLINLIGKIKTENHVETVDGIDTENYHNRFVSANTPNEDDDEHIIRNKTELLKNYQESAFCLPDFPELFDWKTKCFPVVLFTEDSFGPQHNPFHGEAQPVYRTLLQQTIQCLTTLNNQTYRLLRMDIAKRIAHLQAALSGISCTGKGSNENTDYNKNVSVRINGADSEHTISCVPHFKLIRRNSDYRIYFSWGKEEIEKNAFIVVKIGNHWNDRIDSGLSRIELHS